MSIGLQSDQSPLGGDGHVVGLKPDVTCHFCAARGLRAAETESTRAGD